MATLRDAFLSGSFERNPNLGTQTAANIDRTVAATEAQTLQNQFAPEREARAAQASDIQAQASERLQIDAAKKGILEANETDRLEGVRVARQVAAVKTPQEFAFLQRQNPIDLGESTFEDAQLNSRFVLAANDEIEKQGFKSAAESFFESQIANLPIEEQERARRINLGLDPRAIGAAPRIQDVGGVDRLVTAGVATPVEVGGEQVTAETTAEAKAKVKEAESFAQSKGTSRQKAIDEGVKNIQAIDKNIINLQEVPRLIDEGAETGVIASKLPSFRAASIQLDNVRSKLGLDVVGGVTFGALSKGELDLALSVALPTNLEGQELKDWANAKIAAQTKLREYFNDQVQFLNNGGDIAGFLEAMSDSQTTKSGDQGTLSSGKSFVKNPDGSVTVFD